MFTEARLSNFKSFRGEHMIPLRKLAVLIGPNGSGKSSVLQAIQVWRQSGGAGTLVINGDSIDLGAPKDVVNGAGPGLLGLTVEKSLSLPM